MRNTDAPLIAKLALRKMFSYIVAINDEALFHSRERSSTGTRSDDDIVVLARCGISGIVGKTFACEQGS